ncbi:cysteine-rich receptor-like protein kinase 25 [Actinidia eriantha]|uniref:cysteine-rich receptor-like protein kinase 25 n=1 Tax=Actinidia eriantha TaxID=165200 RepID=UPI002584EEA2|nr:cysteine-rich receptor-like protein kinase 25 [Actinidia eriantha]XP_057513735.1 cysteine-rich receptor-like protein kinase 25 [Actinidia eriantha]XP_057513736.1 cysteine-rich receptor-like protein kinase 25 [Actinidia eriantha]XP_057513737.1 cysteine-rich receptor-like protein kinase 25 [Actinidia eriantha]
MFMVQDMGANLLLVMITITGVAIGSVTGQPLYHVCSNYTANAAYQTDLDTLLSSLTPKAVSQHFDNDSLNGISSLYLCRGDVTHDQCQNCVKNASQDIRSRCPSDKEAIIWYDECMLRYSNATIFGVEAIFPGFFMWNVQNNNNSSPNEPDIDANALMYNLIRVARDDEMMFAADEGSAGGGTRTTYGLVQCTRDITSDECGDCLVKLLKQSEECCQAKIGWRRSGPSCNLRYESYPFFTPKPDAPPPVPVSDAPKGNGGNNTTTIVAIVVPVFTVVFALFGFFFYRSRRLKVQEGTSQVILLNNLEGKTRMQRMEEGLDDKGEDDDGGEMHYFNLTTIQIATNNFSDANKLGEGGFGPVYKGKLPDGKAIAVKRLSKNSGQGLEEFKAEVKFIVKLQHNNLVRLIGCCTKGDEKLLVYEYMANTSLDAFLFDATKCVELDWAKRVNIINGTARGLLYLHEDSRLKIIHRDLKASNILLDDEMNPKISDFGTARTFYAKQVEASTNRVVGTYGYMAPEYAMEGLFSTKSDVYSFGVLMLEVISGRRNGGFNLEARAQNLLPYAWRSWNEGKAEELIDRNVIRTCHVGEAVRWINIALLCVQEDPEDRPSMSKVVLMLGGKSEKLPKPSEPPFSVGRLAVSDYSSTSDLVTVSTNVSTR